MQAACDVVRHHTDHLVAVLKLDAPPTTDGSACSASPRRINQFGPSGQNDPHCRDQGPGWRQPGPGGPGAGYVGMTHPAAWSQLRNDERSPLSFQSFGTHWRSGLMYAWSSELASMTPGLATELVSAGGPIRPSDVAGVERRLADISLDVAGEPWDTIRVSSGYASRPATCLAPLESARLAHDLPGDRRS